jgi:hypothetical protein
MKATAPLLLAICALTLTAHASEPVLWALDLGPNAGLGVSEAISLDPLAVSPAVYPDGLDFLMDASYDTSSSLLYVTGGYTDEPWWYQNTVHVYSGGPDGLVFLSASNAGMDNYHWPAGIAYLDGSLYAVAYTGFFEDNVLVRIDSPGTAAQTVTRIGVVLGATNDMGTPLNLCPDGRGALLSMFTPEATETVLYRLDPVTGAATILHTYSGGIFQGSIEGLTIAGNSLYGINTDGDLWRFDLSTYEPTFLGTTGVGAWTGLVTIPEPSTLGALGLGLALLVARLRKPRA